MFDRFSTACLRVIFLTRAEAGLAGSKAIDTEHLLLGVARIDPAVFQQISIPIAPEWIRERATLWHIPGEKLPTSVELPLTRDVKCVLEKATALAETRKCTFVRTEHLLLALMTAVPSHAAVLLEEAGASLELLEDLVAKLNCNEQQEGIALSIEDLT